MADFCADKKGEDVEKNIKISSSLYDYEVFFTSNFEKTLNDIDEKFTYVIDRNVYDLYENRFSNIDKDLIYFVDAVESKKNIDTVIDIMAFWQNIKMKKNWKVACFGGGITQDVTTIAANLYLRNVEWYFFPTTLLSMCDSCIGGKCGINFNGFKNQIGVFYPPKKIIIDPCFIDTLSNDDYLNGWGEILKFSLTSDKTFYDDLKKETNYIPCENIVDYIYRGLYIKKVIIEEDEFEHDLRRVLNYGHTFGHALESYTKNAIPHGKGVIWGIDVANYIAFKENLIPYDYYLDIKKLIKNSFLLNEIKIEEPKKLFEIIKTDKKVRDNVIYLALLNDKSHLIIFPKEINGDFEKVFEDYIKETHEYYNN